VEFNGLGETKKGKILDLACGQDRLMILLLLETNLSVDDLIRLKTSDVDLEKGILLDSSGNLINLSAHALGELKNHLGARPKQTYLFEGRCGKPLTIKWKRCVLEKILGSPTLRKDI
jgi:integrase